jgi:exonuclease III
MNHQLKYLKYKSKYFNLKNQQTGGEIQFKCNEPFNHYCDIGTKNYGLCVNKKEMCNVKNYKLENVQIQNIDQLKLIESETEEIQLDNQKGERKGYKKDNLGQFCGQVDKPIEYNYMIKNKITILTLNVMGIYREQKPYSESVLKLMEKRMEMLRNNILKENIDVLCFQEMSQTALDFLYTTELQKIFPFKYENDITNIKQNRKKDIEVYIISKYPLSKVTIYPLFGNLDYTNSLGVYEFDNLVIYNVYLQAGSKFSPGQKHYAIHYSRCRSQQLRFIQDLINKIKKPSIILGDFNFDLNGPESEWNELAVLNSFGFIDSWKEINPGNPGFSENTEINHMRWNSKFEKKQLRYDGILYAGNNITTTKSTLFGTEGELLIGDNNDHYIKAILDNKSDDPRIKYADSSEMSSNSNSELLSNDQKIFKLFISDHFGVLTTFNLV